MVHSRVSDEYIHFSFMYTTDHIYPVISIKHLLNQGGEPTTPQKMATSTKSSLSNIHILFCPCVVQKLTAHVYKNILNIRHQLQNGFGVSLLEFYNIKSGTSSTYLLYVK